MNVVYCKVHLSGTLSKPGHFLLLKRKFSYDPATKPSNIRIYFVKSFSKSHSLQETKASSTVSSETNRGDKIIVGVVIYTKLIRRMVLSTQEKSSSTATLRYSCPQIELSSENTENSQETIHEAATFLKLVLVMDNFF